MGAVALQAFQFAPVFLHVVTLLSKLLTLNLMCPVESPDTNTNRQFRIRVEGEAIRLDLALLAYLQKIEPTFSRSKLKAWFQQGYILYRNVTASASDIFSAGEYEITLTHCELTPPVAAQSQTGSFLPIIYEDEDLFVLHKTSGIPSVPHTPLETQTAVGSALAHFPELSQVGQKGLEPGLLHRLDTETSGLLVFAKHTREYDRLRDVWKKRSIKKIYRAIVHLSSPMKKIPFTLDAPLGHSLKSKKKMIALSHQSHHKIRGKPLSAITHLLSAQTLREQPGRVSLADVEVEIETGVMHQIRCHLSSQGWPILGDRVYQGPPSDRLWLHAWKLEFPLESSQTLSLEAKLPDHWPR
jgi:23S rRNA pseudouridine1911/1915/1917 synthase